jgi:lipoyl(octanoyl) transferase
MEIEQLGRQPYAPVYAAMREYTAKRPMSSQAAGDVLWLCEHEPVFTQGLAGKPEHVLSAGNIPVVQTDRGGQVTYHGPGQVVAYPLINLQARGYFVKEYVHRIEESVIRTLAEFGVTGHRVRGAPGIYVRLDSPGGHERLLGADGQPLQEAELIRRADIGKIAALGIKVSRHCTYHGVAMNVDMDLRPYAQINACGYPGLATVDMKSLGVQASWQAVAACLGTKLVNYLAV